MGKTRDLIKKMRTFQGIISCKDGHNKGQKQYGPSRSRRYQEEKNYTQKNYTKKISMTQVTTMVWSTHIEPDILECEVKWALGTITLKKASGGDGIPAELFRIPKDDVVKVLRSICQQIQKTQQRPQDWKRSVFIPIPKKGNARNAQTISQSHSSHTLVK